MKQRTEWTSCVGGSNKQSITEQQCKFICLSSEPSTYFHLTNSRMCWLRNMECNGLGSRPSGELSEEEDSATNLDIGYTGEENSGYEDEDDGGQLISRKVAARLLDQPAPCRGKVSRNCRYILFSFSHQTPTVC